MNLTVEGSDCSLTELVPLTDFEIIPTEVDAKCKNCPSLVNLINQYQERLDNLRVLLKVERSKTDRYEKVNTELLAYYNQAYFLLPPHQRPPRIQLYRHWRF